MRQYCCAHPLTESIHKWDIGVWDAVNKQRRAAVRLSHNEIALARRAQHEVRIGILVSKSAIGVEVMKEYIIATLQSMTRASLHILLHIETEEMETTHDLSFRLWQHTHD